MPPDPAEHEISARTNGTPPAPYYGYAGYPTPERADDPLLLLRRGKWIILLCVAAATAAAALYTSFLEPEYEAATLVLVQPNASSSPIAPGGLFTPGQRSLTNELIVLRSSLPIARRVAERVLEADDPSLTIARDAEGRPLEAGAIARRLQWQYVRVGSEGRDADVVRVTATSANPDEAALLANLYAQEYVQLTQEASRASVSASRRYLEEQLALRFEQLQDVERRVQAYMTQTGAFALDSEGEKLVEQIGTLEAQRDEARVELRVRAASLREREEELRALYPQLSQGLASGVEAEIRSAQEGLVELEVARNRLMLRPDSDKLAELEAEIDARRAQLETLSKRYVDEVAAAGGVDLMPGGHGREYITDLNREMVADRVATTGLEAKLEVLETRLAEQEARLKRLPEQAIRLAQLQRERQAAERLYAGVTERLQELRITEESELGYASIIREALVPAAPVRPNTRRNIAIGLLAGLALGLAGATARQRRDRRLYSLDDARRATGSVIGAIPRMNGRPRRETVQVDGREIGAAVVTLLNGMSPAAEAFRHVRTNLQHSGVRTVVVTSACPGEGKTTTAANIAVVMAQAGRRTLLLDADLRRPRVHTLFGRPSRAGLITMLAQSELTADTSLTDTGIDNLHVLPVERGVDNPSELLGSDRMRLLMDALGQVYDVVVIDTPPVLAATDAALLATQSDATVVVARAGMTEMPDLEHCMTLLGHVDAHVVGGVLNAFDPPRKYAYRYGRDVRRLPGVASQSARNGATPHNLVLGDVEARRPSAGSEASDHVASDREPPVQRLRWHT